MPYPQPFGGRAGSSAGHINGTGTLRLVTTPAGGGGEILIPVPGNVLWRLIAIAGLVTLPPAAGTSAIITFFIRDPSDTVYNSLATFSQLPNDGVPYNWSYCTNTAGTSGFSGTINGQWGESAYALAGGSLRVSYAPGPAAPPNFGTALLLVEEWTH